jgi:hypothetical protein
MNPDGSDTIVAGCHRPDGIVVDAVGYASWDYYPSDFCRPDRRVGVPNLNDGSIVRGDAPRILISCLSAVLAITAQHRSVEPRLTFEAKLCGNVHELGKGGCLHLSHHLAAVCLYGDLANAELETNLLVQ